MWKQLIYTKTRVQILCWIFLCCLLLNIKNTPTLWQVFVQSDVLQVALDMRNQFDEVEALKHINVSNPAILCDSEGWLLSNPMGIRTEREIHAELEGAKIFRRLYQKQIWIWVLKINYFVDLLSYYEAKRTTLFMSDINGKEHSWDTLCTPHDTSNFHNMLGLFFCLQGACQWSSHGAYHT